MGIESTAAVAITHRLAEHTLTARTTTQTEGWMETTSWKEAKEEIMRTEFFACVLPTAHVTLQPYSHADVLLEYQVLYNQTRQGHITRCVMDENRCRNGYITDTMRRSTSEYKAGVRQRVNKRKRKIEKCRNKCNTVDRPPPPYRPKY